MPENFINPDQNSQRKDNKKVWDIEIPEEEMVFSVARSSGPGGQNVNKVSTKVILKWPFQDSNVVDDEQKEKIAAKLANRINKEDELIIQSSETRSQLQNRQRAIFRLHEVVNKALEEKIQRKKTRPSRAAKEKRLREKKITSRKKEQRRQVEDW